MWRESRHVVHWYDKKLKHLYAKKYRSVLKKEHGVGVLRLRAQLRKLVKYVKKTT